MTCAYFVLSGDNLWHYIFDFQNRNFDFLKGEFKQHVAHMIMISQFSLFFESVFETLNLFLSLVSFPDLCGLH